jgi:16S rRNA pseudouridine516 synthase
MIRLDALLARNLACSRTAAARLLQDGRVQDDRGTVLEADDRRRAIDEATLPLSVRVDGQTRTLVAAAHILLNKPAGCVTALRDPVHRTAYELLETAPLYPELRPVGRLDLDTTGLLLWTTEGAWVQRLTHPKRNVPRTYQAALARPHGALPADLTLDDGHRPNIVALEPLAPNELHPSLPLPAEAAAFASITVVGGAYHEVRRIFAALGSHVLSLCRVGFGRLALPVDLAPGQYRPIDITDA